MQRLLFWCCCVLLVSTTSSGCFLVKMVKDSRYSKRDRFVKSVVSGPSALTKAQKLALLGKPDAGSSSTKHALALKPKHTVVLAMNMPKFSGYCESVSVYIPDKWSHEGAFRLSIAGNPKGPWSPVAVGSKTKAFDIDGTPMAVARYIRIEALTSSRTQLWLDAVRLRVHTKTWKPPMFAKPAYANKKEEKQAKEQFKFLWRQSQAAFQARRYGTARANLREALSLRPNHAPVLLMLGATYHAMERWYQAIRHYRRGFKLGKARREHYEEIADSFLSLKAPELARPFVNQCIATDPLYPRCYYKRLHLASLTKNRLALAFYREVYKIVRRRTHIQQRRLTLQQFLAQYFGGKAPLIATYPQAFTCVQHIAWVDFLMRLFPRERQAIILFSQSSIQARMERLVTAGKKLEGQFYWASYLYRTQQIDRSLRVLRVLEKQESRPLWLRRAYLLHGRIWEERGKPQKATALYKQAYKRLISSPHGRPFFLKTMGKELSSVLAETKKETKPAPKAVTKAKAESDDDSD